MATGEPAVVAAAAALLTAVLRHNAAALPRLYATGAFFFALSYCGSNLVELAALLRVRCLPRFWRIPCLEYGPGLICGDSFAYLHRVRQAFAAQLACLMQHEGPAML